MALSALQRVVYRTLADSRRRLGESDVAGGGALNEAIGGARRSRDIDLLHDTTAALVSTWASSAWHAAVNEAREIVRTLPANEVGKCVLDRDGRPLKASPSTLAEELSGGRVVFHEGRIRGAFPELPT